MRLRDALFCSALGFGLFIGVGQARAWEMKVCLEPNNPPASDQLTGGYEVRIASLLAEALKARPSYVWIPITPTNVRDYLRVGVCDLVMGVPDGFLGLTTTVPYYQIPHVLLFRREHPIPTASLEDPVLRSLKIATYPLSQIDFALRSVGVTPVLFRPPSILNQLDVAQPLVQAVLDGRVDAAVLSGSVAAYYAKKYPDRLALAAVAPELVGMSPMFQMGTIGLRPGDTELRDLLNLAIAERWKEIQKVFEELGIPMALLPQPLAGAAEETVLKVGVVLPIPTGYPAITDAVGRSAQLGAMVAENLLSRKLEAKQGITLKVLLASAPTPQAAQRAAERLVEVERVSALVGGLGSDQASVLKDVAEKAHVPFFNIGEAKEEFRSCSPYVFHVEASQEMYLRGLVRDLVARGTRRWFLLYPASPHGQKMADLAQRIIASNGGAVVGQWGVPQGVRIYQPVLETAGHQGTEALLSLLPPEDQDFLVAQLEGPLAFSVVHFPYPEVQTRVYWLRMRQVTDRPETTYRLDLWEGTANSGRALNDEFASRTGVPMDPSAWAVYAAVKVVVDSALATGSTDPTRIARYVADPHTRFDLYKGAPLAFRPGDHQLLQPLYLVQVNPQAELGVRLSQLQGLVRLVGEVPEVSPGADPLPLLEQLAGPDPCR